jgi:hypothetical protein
VTGVVVAPSLIGRPASRVGQGAGSATAAAPTTAGSMADGQRSAAAKTGGTDPSGKAQPAASFTGKPVPSPTLSPALSPTKAPAGDQTWDPAGSLIADRTVLATAPRVAATDTDFQAWGGTLLDESTVKVVFADRAAIRSSGPDDLRPLVVVTGRAVGAGPLRLDVLTSVAGSADAQNLSALTVAASTTVPADGPQAIAVSNGLTMYVAAEAGVDSATYTYRDDTGEHTAAMKVAGGVATAPVPQADLKASAVGAITNIRAVSHGKVVWDAAPVPGR